MPDPRQLPPDHPMPQDFDLGGVVIVDIDTQAVERGLRQRAVDWPRVLEYSATEIGRGVRLDFQRTTRSWQKRPEFTTDVATGPFGAEVMVGTNDAVYNFVDRGTRAHWIAPRYPGGVLAFQWGGPGSYVAKTTPGFLGSQAGGPTGGRVVRRVVRHPGSAPRDFSKIIHWRWQSKAPDILRKYAANWARGGETTPPGATGEE